MSQRTCVGASRIRAGAERRASTKQVGGRSLATMRARTIVLLGAAAVWGACALDSGESREPDGGTATHANVECAVASDCGTWPTPACGSWSCPAGVCVLTLEDARTPVGLDTFGDCHYDGCDGGGSITQWYDSADVPDDFDPCTNDYCDGYAPSHVKWPAGSTCGTLVYPGSTATFAKTCNAAGQCVPACQDGVKNGNETDVDCGGVWPCLPCGNGDTCNTFQDCQSKRCIGGICVPCFSASECASGVCAGGFCQ